MAEFLKPSTLSSVWAIAGDRIKPAEEKMQSGWLVEIPMRQYENWLTNRQDAAIAHFNQRGVAEWDNATEYLAGKSYTQGKNGIVYKALITNVNTDPTTSTGAWTEAFVSADSEESRRIFNGYLAISGDITASSNSRYYALGSLTLTLPSTASLGYNVVINKSSFAEVTVVVANAGKIRAGNDLVDDVLYDILDEVNFTWNGTTWQVQ
jgi:hypothetical protein